MIQKHSYFLSYLHAGAVQQTGWLPSCPTIVLQLHFCGSQQSEVINLSILVDRWSSYVWSVDGLVVVDSKRSPRGSTCGVQWVEERLCWWTSSLTHWKVWIQTSNAAGSTTMTSCKTCMPECMRRRNKHRLEMYQGKNFSSDFFFFLGNHG